MDSANSSIVPYSTSKLTKLAPSKRALFLATYRRNQSWSPPKPIIEYIAKNPLSPKVYEKLIKSCKYFFASNSLLVVERLTLQYFHNEWRTYFNVKRAVDLRDISSKLWITNKLAVDCFEKNPDVQYFSSTILPKLYQNVILINFNLQGQNITLNDLIWVASKCEEIDLKKVTVKDENGALITMEKIIEALPNVKSFSYDFEDSDPKMITSKTVQEMIKIPHFLTLKYLNLVDLPESFNLDDFYSYIRKISRQQFVSDFMMLCFLMHTNSAFKKLLMKLSVM